MQELYALLLAHVVIRLLIMQAAETAQMAPTQISFTETIRLMHDYQPMLGLVTAERRREMVKQALAEMARQRIPKTRVRIQARVVKRVRSRYERKKPEHWHAPALEHDLEFSHIIDLVT